jgi:alpha-glucosidase
MIRFIAVALVTGSFLFAGQAAVAQPEEGVYYRIKSANSDKVLAIDDGDKAEGAKVVQRVVQPSEGQQWKFVKNGDYYNIVNRKTGMSMNVSGASKDQGAPIIQWGAKDNNRKDQQWSIEKKDDHFVFKARNSGLVLDVAGASKDRKVELIQWPFSGNKNQLFELLPVKK